MSRSYRKPYDYIVCHSSRGLKKDKDSSNRVVRRTTFDIPSGNYYRKVVDNWGWATDGKKRWLDPKEWPKAIRK